MSKQYKYTVGDIVVFKQVIGHYGSAKGCARNIDLLHYQGEMGKVDRIYPAAREYPYQITLYRTTINGIEIKQTYRLIEAELEPLFVV